MFADFTHSLYKCFIYKDRYLLFIEGIQNTLLIALVAVFIGIAIGMLIAVIRVYHQQTGKFKFANAVCGLYLTVIRGTPMVVQLLIMYFVIFASARNGVPVAMLAFGINSGAYVAEIFRAGIQAVDKGQTEAGRSLGLSSAQTMRHIVLPQAIKNVLPALGNEFIVLFKETAIVGYIAIVDLTRAADIIRGQSYEAFIPLFTAAAMYLIIVIILTQLLKVFERRLAKSDRG
ncbi:MAG: amino acid ABC transporter permease [Clostridia bacterium]|nr:amino acid ABC transporter permease [Clostridia bacterium]MDD4799250.1 amino acid ABC transporter permease [Clostridia bacterium]